MGRIIKGAITDLHKKMLIDVFHSFLEICEKHELKFFCCGGTAIGAVRHQGMIPWDDDIDILMPRPDYERFIHVFSKMEEDSDYELITMENNDRYYLPFAKMCNKHTTLLEYRDIPCLLGVYVDIFPLDGASSDAVERVSLLNNFRRAANKLLVLPKSTSENIRRGVLRIFKGQLRTALNEFRYAFNKKKARERVVDEIRNIMMKHSYEDSKYVGNYGGMWGIKEFGPKGWFLDYKEKDFEGFKVRIPVGFDALLTQMYGNYMELPPVGKRVSHHHMAYINLEKRVSLVEVLKKV